MAGGLTPGLTWVEDHRQILHLVLHPQLGRRHTNRDLSGFAGYAAAAPSGFPAAASAGNPRRISRHQPGMMAGARRGDRTDDLPITSRKPSSSRCRLDPFRLLTSAGSPVACVPDRSVLAGGMTKRMTGLSLRKPHRTLATFRSGSEGRSSTGEPTCRRCRLMVSQQLPTEIGWRGEHRGRGLTLNAFVATLSALANRQWTEGHDPGDTILGQSSWE
jgi:hypothetical protein